MIHSFLLAVTSDFLTRMEEIFPHFLRRVFISAFYIFAAYLLAQLWRITVKRASKAILEKAAEASPDFTGRVGTISVILKRTGYVAIFITAFLMLLGEMGVAIGPLLTGLGIVGVAVGFGAQYLVKDLISGLFIVLEDHFRVGESVKIDSFEGTVESISLRTTKLRGFGGQFFIIPNGEIRSVTNLSRDWIRAVVEVDLPYDVDPEKAIAALNQVAGNLSKNDTFAGNLLEDVEPQGVLAFGQSALRYRVVAKMKPGVRFEAENLIRKEILKVLKEKGIEVPYSQMDVNIKK
jgi:moderate conductance mechanosensitive channel